MPKEDVKHLIALSTRLLLECGAETYRVEDTVRYLAQHFGAKDAQAIALPTGLFYSITDPDGHTSTQVLRVHRRSTNLSTIARVNDISRALIDGSLPLQSGISALEALENGSKPQPEWLTMLGSSAAAGFFALLFNGSLSDLLVAALCGVITQAMSRLLRQSTLLSACVYLFSAGMVAAAVAKLSLFWIPAGSISAITIGAIMPLLPGLLITNAVRDTISGDLVSGTARGAEALVRCLAIAAGVGVVLALWRI